MRQLRGGGENQEDEEMKTPASKNMKTMRSGSEDQFHHGPEDIE